jgi:Zinc carboxypeptidase
MNTLTAEFPEVLKKFSIGKTSQNRDINGYLLGLNLTSKQVTMEKPALLIDGAHHARDLSTISMSVYTVVRLLYGYV